MLFSFFYGPDDPLKGGKENIMNASLNAKIDSKNPQFPKTNEPLKLSRSLCLAERGI